MFSPGPGTLGHRDVQVENKVNLDFFGANVTQGILVFLPWPTCSIVLIITIEIQLAAVVCTVFGETEQPHTATKALSQI
jgi:hypothetical protein